MTRLVEEAPGGADWLHEIKYHGYRMHARIDGDKIQLVFFAFDLLFLNGQSTAQLPLIERKERLKRLFKEVIQGAAVQRACDW